jgi:hypothetical protein
MVALRHHFLIDAHGIDPEKPRLPDDANPASEKVPQILSYRYPPRVIYYDATLVDFFGAPRVRKSCERWTSVEWYMLETAPDLVRKGARK